MTTKESTKKIVVIGGTGLIGSKVVTNLGERGYEVVAASPASGVNTLTGAGLAEVLEGASVVVDVSNSPSFEDTAVMEFFQTSTRNLLNAEAAAGVGHHVVLSIVGCDRLPDSGYMRAKVAQEKLIKESSIPYSIVRATQFFEFVLRIADSATEGNTVRLPSVGFQPLAADDVATVVSNIAIGSPLNRTVEVAGPERFRFDELIRLDLNARKEPREVIADPHARYFGTELSDGSLVPSGDPLLGETRFEDWLSRSASQVAPTNPQPTAVAAASKATTGPRR
ncbi:MAG TPA: SDR family oxidoreductase [Pyrinomonadaceae bacterium]|nr:SDR family oxidoreductase [Pyrinomonadaceae bacterium]